MTVLAWLAVWIGTGLVVSLIVGRAIRNGDSGLSEDSQ